MTVSPERLDAEAIRAALAPGTSARVRHIEVLPCIDSTNAELLRRPAVPTGTCDLLYAEAQTAGRGRRGRRWMAPAGRAICLSISWSYARTPEDLGAMSLAMGVCVRRALVQMGLASITLKWPNDLQVEGQKLGGILIELRPVSDGPPAGVVGVGLNVALGESIRAQIAASGTEATDLETQGLKDLSRNRLAAAIASDCVQGLTEFERSTLASFVREWAEADALQGREVSVQGPTACLRGIARGIDLHGALRLETPRGIERILSGDVSVRPR